MNSRKQVNLFKRRSIIIGGIQGVLLTGLLGRLINLQIFNSNHYQLLSDKNRLQLRLLQAPRGYILDRNGYQIASNQSLYSCFIIPSADVSFADTLSKLEKILNLSVKDRKTIESQLKSRVTIGVLVKENLSWEEMALLELNLPELPGLIIEKGLIRKYLNPESFCHIVGYVSRVSNNDDRSKLPPIPNLRIGKIGIEKIFENKLAGVPGSQQVEINARRQVVKVLNSITAINGAPIDLSLDFKLQQRVVELLSEHRSAAASVMDLNTGELLAFVSYPGYNNNLFVSGIENRDWNNLLTHPDQPLINKLVSGLYSPGSTFKMMVALATLRKNVVNHKARFYCPGYFEFGNRRFHCWNWKYGGHGHMDMENALSKSCDIYFYNVALMMGMEPICEVAELFGLSKLTGIEVTNEKSGLLPNSGSFLDLFKKGQKGHVLNLSIGQGAILSTPMQLLQMVGALAKGYKIKPTLIKNGNRENKFSKELIVPKEHLDIVRKGMEGVVREGGTAFNAKIGIERLEMAGKTGTTQVSKITMAQRKDGSYKDLPYHLRDHALFVGYAPYYDPRFAVCVIVEHGKSGGKVAAPLGAKILEATQNIITGLDKNV
jgi:penicillin-binding protein 2